VLNLEDKIALIGMMGCGKSVVGKKIAQILGFEYVDLDEKFEKSYGSIERYFEKYGEDKFRTLESDLLERYSKTDRIVLSTGGGIVERPKNREILKAMHTFYLEGDPEVLWNRVKNSSRPLVKIGKNAFFSRFEKRKPFYETYETIHTGFLGIDHLSAIIVKKVTESRQIDELDSYQKVKIFHNVDIERSDLCLVAKIVKKIWNVDGTEVDDGEEFKSIESAQKLWKLFLEKGLSRNSKITAIGGGTVTDAIGFVSTTYMRGMNFELYPTTLLGMVDAAIGGKFAINFNGVKNLVGTFGKPDVFIDTIYALSLDDERFKEGIVESVKIGAVYDEKLFQYMEDNMGKIIDKNLDVVDEVIKNAVKDKLEVILKDPHDQNLRHILNFGHTIGHAIESASNNSISHGHAVGIGMIVESEKFSPKVHERIKNVITSLGFKPEKNENLMRWILSDKKKVGNAVVIPVIEKIGNSHLEKIGIEILSDH
jgi:3-dehydroquinate synthetase/broad-specificity NMP kinase